ncbi:hypothetical protein BHE74_00049455 [Ensete ventricosum]|uniref:Uncharacterized protein n=1 Tax=Ensete ventricosum TaxID=4639 RepID=A0A445MLM2_ENSVE|nr:hypothetical protein BHE74_00049455 [Ensete ventricosum]RZR75174.1 hypothetical protein BHM03_00050975 [Ensete ventricosum]
MAGRGSGYCINYVRSKERQGGVAVVGWLVDSNKIRRFGRREMRRKEGVRLRAVRLGATGDRWALERRSVGLTVSSGCRYGRGGQLMSIGEEERWADGWQRW